jgi:hypothetical protein
VMLKVLSQNQGTLGGNSTDLKSFTSALKMSEKAKLIKNKQTWKVF